MVFGGTSTVNVLASDATSTIAGRAALRDNNTTLNVADGTAATDLLVSAAITGASNVTKTGLGTMSLTGANTHTGTTFISGGNSLLSGSITGSSLAVGNISGTPAAMYQAGTVTTGGGGLRIGQTAGAFGYYKLSSGALTLPVGGEVDPAGNAAGAGTFGQFDMVGGSVGGGDYLLPNRGAAGSSSVTNITGGTFTIPSTVVDNAFNGLSANWQSTGAAQTAVITIKGIGQFVSPTVRVKLNEGVNFNGLTGNSANVTSLNLGSGGLLQTLGFLTGTATNVSINFNGGTLKAGSAGNASFLSGLGSVNVYSGNASIDNNGQVIEIAQPFLAATGTGVSAVPVTVAGSGYITPPQVTFSGGTVTGGAGSAATGYATIDSTTGKLTGIVLTNLGTYSNTTGLAVSITGGGGSGATLGAISTAANTSGGVTFSGAGSTTLTGTSTYSGATTVNSGTLRLNGFVDINASSGVTVNGSGAKLLQISSTTLTPTVTLTQGTVDGTGTISTLNVGNSVGNTVAVGNGSSGSLAIGSLTFNGAATVNLGLNGTLVDKSIATSSLATNTAGMVTLNVTNPGLWVTGSYDLISYSGTLGGAGFSKFALGPLAGLGGRQSAALANTGTAVALVIAGDSPVWTGLFSGEWSTGIIGGSKNWKMLTSGGATDFLANDLVLFDDTATGTTTITINDGTVSPISTLFNNSALNYTLGGSNGINTGTLTKNGAGSLVLNNPNSYSGATTLNGGTLHINNASAIGTGTLVINGGAINNTSGSLKTLSTNNPQNWNGNFTFGGSNDLNLGTGAVTLAASEIVTTNGSAVLTVGGVVSGTGFGLTKYGTGTLTLNGANAYTGNTTAGGGTLNLTGTAAMTGGLFVGGGGTLNLNGTFGTNTVNNTFIVGQGSGTGTLNILPSVSISRANLFIADTYGVDGAVYQSGGAVTLTQGASADNLRIGSTASGNGYYNISGGTLTANEIGVGGLANDTTGVMDVSGGTVTDKGWLVIGRGGATSSGAMNVTGGAVLFGATTANPLALNWAGTSGASSVINLGGGAGAATITGPSTGTAGKGLNLSFSNIAGTSGIVNLLTNGTLTVNEVVVGNANPTALLNFNGGTLKATAASRGVAFMPAANVDGVYVYGGGGTIDNSNTNITIAAALVAPTVGSGNGVNGITSFTGGAGYIGAPLVKVVNDPGDTTGVGATAVATVAGGVVTGITITNPGVGYTAPPTFTVTGGGATTAATIIGTAPTANSSGAMTFSGTGFTTLTGTNLYTGGSTVNGGILQITDDTQLGAVPGSPTVNITLKGGVLYNNNSTPSISANRTISLDATGGYLQAGWAPKTITVNGLITGVGGLGINWDGGSVVLTAVNNYAGNTTIGTAGPGYYVNVAANPTLKLGIDNALPYGTGKGNLNFGTSANANIPTLDLNGHNAQVNGLTGSANAVIDNLTGAGSYVLTAGNNDQTSTFAGTVNNTSGTVGFTKTGSGTLTLTGVGNYIGNTTVNNGTLVVNRSNNILNAVTSALGNNQVAHTVTVNNGATLQFNSGDTMGSAVSSLSTTIVINAGGTVTNGGVVFNRLGSVTLNGGTLTSVSGAITGYQTYSFDSSAVVTAGGSAASTITTNGTFNGIHLNTNTFFNVTDATSSSATDLTVSAPLIDRNLSEGGSGGLTKTGFGTMTITAVNTYTGVTEIDFGTLQIGDGTTDGSIASSGGITNNADLVYNLVGTRTYGNIISGFGNLTKKGAGTLTLSGVNTYSGNTIVNAGTLELATTGQLKFVLGATSGVNNSLTGSGTATLKGSFVIDTSAADSLSSGTWTLENVSTLTGAYDAAFSVSGFVDAGGNKWTKANGAKIYTFDETTGILTLAPAGGYSTWASANAPTGTASDDYDKDGVSNGIEYVLGGLSSTNDLGKLPAVSTSGGNFIFTFQRKQNTAADTTVKIDVSTTLVSWPSVYTVSTTTATSTAGVTVTDNLDGTDTVTLTLTQAPDVAKFARLEVTFF